MESHPAAGVPVPARLSNPDRLPSSRRQYVPPTMPGFVEFMHPKVVAKPPDAPEWVHEIKYDGYRFQAHVRGGETTLYTRRGLDWTTQLPEIAAALRGLGEVILDGEVCHLGDDGRPTFSGLRSAMGRGDTAGLVFFAFDILWHEGEDLRPYGLKGRKTVLERALAPVVGERIRLVDCFPTGGKAMITSACRVGLEGIVSKRLDSTYASGRTDQWVKSLCIKEQEFVIGGWEQEARRHFKGVLVGVYGDAGLTYVGTLERGLDAAPDLVPRLRALETKQNPFAAGKPPRVHVHWVRPELVARADFREWTASGKIRHASFRGLRDDKDPREVRREAVV
jgi:bifunctional non-homologous end joining protein LigD